MYNLFPILCFIVSTVALVNFPGATMIISQNSLLNAPHLYASYVQQLIQYVENYPLPNYSDGGSGCHTEWYIEGSAATKNVEIVADSLKIEISSTSTVRNLIVNDSNENNR
jgi:hypothetical protein